MTLSETMQFLDLESDFEGTGPKERSSSLKDINHFFGVSPQTSFRVSSQSTLGSFGYGGGIRYLYRSNRIYISPTIDFLRQSQEGAGFLNTKLGAELGIKVFPSTIYEFPGTTYFYIAPLYGFQSTNDPSSGSGFRYGLTLLLGESSILGVSLGHEISRMRLGDSLQNVQFINLGFFLLVGFDR
jgi:hypothetical protein